MSPLITALSTQPSRRTLREDEYDLNHQPVSPIMSRSPSAASDRFSTISGVTTYFPANPTNVHPAPAYIAHFGANQVVSEHQASKQRPSSDEEDEGPNKEDVQFSDPALALINAFLDQLLYAFLSTARSTSLLALRPAVTEVLKHRLARDAIASADEELQELLAGGEDEEKENTQKNTGEDRRKWDLELVWKRTRLRVMVYTRLGELEDDDEEKYVKEQELFHGNERRFSSTTGLVSWAAAIFLTSVLEYVAEQTLQVAGQAAFKRTRRQTSASAATGAQTPDQVLVEEYDVEKVALNSTLGRLWRTWRKSLRNNGAPNSPTQHDLGRTSIDRSNMVSAMSHRRSSFGTAAEGSVAGDYQPTKFPVGMSRAIPDVPDMQYPEHVLAANIPLPMGETRRDVDEIEVPGLARNPDSDDEDEIKDTSMAAPPVRRNSFTAGHKYQTTGGLPTPDSSNPQSPKDASQRPAMTRLRSKSVPTLNRMFTSAARTLIPGAYPETPAVEEEKELIAPEKEKFHAEEMAPHKRASQDVSKLLDDVAENKPVEETEAQKEKSEHHGLVGAAVAGVAAAGAAAAAMVYGSRQEEQDPSTDGVVARSDRDIQELDKRKSLLDIKSMMSPGSSIPGSGRESPYEVRESQRVTVSQPATPPTVVRTGSNESSKSYTLGDKDKKHVVREPPATRQHMPEQEMQPEDRARDNSAVGIAQNADVDGGKPSMTAQKLMADRDGEQARDATPTTPTSQPSRLVLADLPVNKSRDSPTIPKATESPKSPQEFLQSRSLSYTSKSQDPIEAAEKPRLASPNEQTRANPPAARSPNRASAPGPILTNGAQQSPSVEESPHRQSWTAPIEKGVIRPKSVPVPQKRGSKDEVQEHPVVQRMASLKRNKKEGEAEPKDGALTSAAIKGPEDFDMFVQGGDTMKYTLTPETVRDSVSELQAVYEMYMSDPVQASSQNLYPSARSSQQAIEGAPSQRKRSSPPAPPPIDTRQGRSQTSKPATSSTPRKDDDNDPDRASRRSISRPPPRNISAHRRSGLMAREPRVMTESTRDFADFIRSTGPDKEQPIYPIVTNRSTTSLHSLRSQSANGSLRSHSPGGERTKSLTKSVMEAENIPPVPPMPLPGKGRGSMQPRTAKSGTQSNSDLINFIREGPDQNGQHRISRSVAPFRNTMDSDQFKDLGDRTSTDRPLDLRLNTSVPSAPSLKSAGASSQKSVSNRTSTNSRAALLNGANGANGASQSVHPAYSGQPQRLAAPGAGGEPPRKRYRNKDPYAIDTDDEDGDLLTALPRNKRQEESLADFLRNNEPPKDNGPRPIARGGPAEARSVMNKARTTSMNSLKAANAEQNGAFAQNGRTRSMQSTTGPRPGYAASVRSVQSNKSASSNRQSHIGNQATGALGPKKSMPKMEARSPGSKDTAQLKAFHQSNTADLADFLRSSGPQGPQSAPAPIVGKGPNPLLTGNEKPKKEKRRFFSRKPKSMKKATYLDMP